MKYGVMRRLARPRCARPLAILLSAVIYWTGVSAAFATHLANPFDDAAAHGQSAGNAFVPPPDIATADEQGNITLFPNGASPDTIPASELFPGATGDFSTYSSTYGDDAAMQQLGIDAQAVLEAEESYPGEAYRTIIDSRFLAVPDMRNDPVWAQTDNTLENLATLASEFSECTATTTMVTGTRPVHVPDYRQCEVVGDSSVNCSIPHSYDASLLYHVSGPFNMSSCGTGCVDIWLGRVGDNYWRGYCTIYEEGLSIFVENPQAITSAVIEYAKWDDYMQIYVGDQLTWCGPYNDRVTVTRVNLNGTLFNTTDLTCSGNTCTFTPLDIWSSVTYTVDLASREYYYDDWYDEYGTLGPYALNTWSTETFETCTFPPETPGRCELSTSWERNPGVDVTSIFQQGGLLTFKVRVSVADRGEGYARIRLYYDPLRAVIQDAWGTPTDQCQAGITGLNDGVCTGAVTCGLMPPDVVNGCTEINGVRVCEEHLQPSPYPGISPLCQRVDVSANCTGFYTGPMECWTDINGVERCPNNDGGSTDSCAQYRDDPNCGFISSTCLGPQGQSGTCYVVEQTWDCGTTTQVPTTGTGTTYDCAGPIRCMGNDCVTQITESNPDLARAIGALNTAQHITQDAACADWELVDECRIFSGEAYECKRAVGGIVNCCETPDGVSLAEYLSLIYKLNEAGAFETAANWAVQVPPIRGSWEALQTGWDAVSGTFTDAWSSVSDWFGSAWNSMGGTTSAAATEQAASLSLEQFKQQIMEAAAEWTREMFGDAVADALFEQTAEDVVLDSAITDSLQTLSTIYMYYMIAMLIINIIWECEERELELGAKRELRLCHSVGSYCRTRVAGACVETRRAYCCFNSPLSRIIQEQVRPQFGMTWGTPRNPQCEGLTIDQLATVDWSQVNLDEWIGLLNMAGMYPDTTNLSLDQMTGVGHSLNIDGTRPNAQQRALQRIEGLDTTGARISAGQELR